MKRRSRLYRWLAARLAAARRFFDEVPGSLRDHLNAEELIRIAATAMTAGGGVFGLLEAIIAHANTIFPAPADAALAAALFTAMLETSRRLRHGNAVSVGGARTRFLR